MRSDRSRARSGAISRSTSGRQLGSRSFGSVSGSHNDRSKGFVRLGRGTDLRDRDRRHADSGVGRDGKSGRRHGRSSHGHGRHHGHSRHHYYGYPYFSFFPYFGLWGYDYDWNHGWGYSLGFGSGYRYSPWYDYGYANTNQYFDIDVYQVSPQAGYVGGQDAYYDSTADYLSIITPDSVTSRTTVSSGSGAVADQVDTVGDKMLAEGQAAMVKSQFDEARQLFSQAMFLDDRDGRAKLLFAMASLGEGNVDLAALALRRALLTTPELIDNPWDLRTIWSDEQAYRRQTGELAGYLVDYKEHRGARLLLGYLHFGWGDAQGAHDMFAKLVRADPEDTLAIKLRDAAARVLKHMGVGG